MAFRRKMTRKKSKKNFRRGTKVHKKNHSHNIKRGGIRL